MRRSVAVASGWAVALTVFTYFGTRGAEEDRGPDLRPIDTVGWVLALVAPLLLCAVWLRPRLVFAVVSLLAAVYIARDYTGGPIYLAGIVASAVLGWREPLRRSYPAVTAAALVTLAAAVYRPTDRAGIGVLVDLLTWSLVPIVPWSLVTILRLNRQSALKEADERHRRAADEERMRVAREVHDVVGHSLAVISMQAGVALHVAERRPEQLTVALDAIARSSREALAELRGTLAVFVGDTADTGEAASGGPAGSSGLADVARLVADFTAGGHPVDAELPEAAGALSHPELPEVPHVVGSAVYRVVQESLTNAARHAGGATIRVRVARRGDGMLVVDVDDDGCGVRAEPARRAGTGLAGMRDRCEVLGGTLTAGPRAGGGWSVHAELPVEAARSGVRP